MNSTISTTMARVTRPEHGSRVKTRTHVRGRLPDRVHLGQQFAQRIERVLDVRARVVALDGHAQRVPRPGGRPGFRCGTRPTGAHLSASVSHARQGDRRPSGRTSADRRRRAAGFAGQLEHAFARQADQLMALLAYPRPIVLGLEAMASGTARYAAGSRVPWRSCSSTKRDWPGVGRAPAPTDDQWLDQVLEVASGVQEAGALGRREPLVAVAAVEVDAEARAGRPGPGSARARRR